MSHRENVVILGEALVDVFPDREELGGAPFNVARNLAALGAAPLLVSRVGRDPSGDRIAGQMSRLGMSVQGLQRDDSKATGRVLVSLDQGQPDFRIEADGAWDWLEPGAALDASAALEPTLIYFGSLAQRSSKSREAICAALAASKAVRLLDLNLRAMTGQREIAEQSLHLTEMLKLNEDELRVLLEWFAPGADPGASAAVFALMARFDLSLLVLTRGAGGWACYERGPQRVLEGPAPRVEVRDTVGAGDAFTAVLVLGELRGWALATTLARAARFSAAVCTLHGAFDEDSVIYREAQESWARPEVQADLSG